MNYTITKPGYDVFYDFAGEGFRVGYILCTGTTNKIYSYTDTLFYEPAVVLCSLSLSDLQDDISDYYSSRDTIGAIEEKWL